MVITSVKFLIFVAISLIVYFKLPTKYQWVLLLADSLFFYFINTRTITFLYLVAAVLVTYGAALSFEKIEDSGKKKAVLFFAILVDAGILAVLKYTNLLVGTVNFFAKEEMLKTVHWVAPLAISFYTLQLLSYVCDCYWGSQKAEKDPLKLLLFTMYFPLMVSGPISRYRDLGKKLFEEHRFDYDRVTGGLRRFAWGMAKKVVVADRLSIPIDHMFRNADIFRGPWVWLAVLSYSMQLYFDFSGCMDMIMGVSECFGITLMENFRAPFFSSTLKEFWQRWHAALGAWLNDYILYPLMKTKPLTAFTASCKKRFGKNGRKYATYPALFVLWSAMGLWHGDSWKYICGEGWWYFAVIIIGMTFEGTFSNWKKALHIRNDHPVWKGFQMVRTYVFFSIGMLFFRADSLPMAFELIRNSFARADHMAAFISLRSDGPWEEFGTYWGLLAVAVFIILQAIADYRVYHKLPVQELVIERPLVVRWVLYIALVFTIAALGAYGQSSFIYFGF